MVLLLSDQHVMEAVGESQDSVRQSIDIMERCFLDEGQGEACLWPKTEILYPPRMRERFESTLSLHTVLGIVPGVGAIGGRIFTSGRRLGQGSHGLGAWKLLFDFETLDLVCLMQDVSVHPYLVGAHVGVATRWLARQNATTVAVVGSGRMAWGSLRAICAVRDISRALIFSPNAEHRRDFARRAREAFGIEAEPVESAQAAVHEADIVSCATNNEVRGGSAVLSAEWVNPGTHVNSIARKEEDSALFAKAKIVPASMEGVMGVEPPWEPFRSAVKDGLVPKKNMVGDLAEIVAGKRSGRADDADVTLYIGPSLGTQHAALAAWVYQQAMDKHVGVQWEVP